MKETEFLQKIGENISKYRKRKKLTLVQIAEQTGMNVSNLIAITKGRKNVTALTVLKIANALEVAPLKLFS